jgi:hypothetical protein
MLFTPSNCGDELQASGRRLRDYRGQPHQLVGLPSDRCNFHSSGEVSEGILAFWLVEPRSLSTAAGVLGTAQFGQSGN